MHPTTAVRGPQQNRKGTCCLLVLMQRGAFYLPSPLPLQLFMVLLEVEETERMKTTVLSEAEERRLTEKSQEKVEHIYFQLQHHNSL